MEHAVIVHLRLSDDQFGHEAEREALFDLQDELREVVDGGGLGEFDGNEFGGGECVFYMYGPDADRIYSAILPILNASGFAQGGWVMRRYGSVDDPLSPEVKVAL